MQTNQQWKISKTTIKSYKGRIKTDFHGNEMPKKCYHWICLSLTLIDSVLKTDKNFYPHVFYDNVNILLKEKRYADILVMT